MTRREDPAALLERAYESVRAALLAQRADRDPAHEDFYSFGYALSVLPQVLSEFAAIVERQVRAYPTRYAVSDDQGRDPQARITEAARHLHVLTATLARAAHMGSEFHCSIGHIAVTGRAGDR